MKHTDVNQSLVDSILGKVVITNDFYGSLRISETLYRFFFIQVSISQASDFWKWKCKDAFRSPISVAENEIVDSFVEYLEYKQKQNDESISKWFPSFFRELKIAQEETNEWPQSLKPVCPECGLDLSKPLGYVCPSTRCPTGLSGPKYKK